MKSLYNFGYKYFRMPWDTGPREELVQIVESGRIKPCKAIDLGCGTGSNAVFLAQHGFEVTGVDFAPSALVKGRKKADAAGVKVSFVVDDLTNLREVNGTYDFLVDYGALDDLTPANRSRYVESVLLITHPGSQFLLWCFEWPLRWWERLGRSVSIGAISLEPGEADERFGGHFTIERIAGTEKPSYKNWPPGFAAYLMTRK